MKNFKQYITEFDAPNIYCDMDGVLADFTSFTTKFLGKPFKDEDWLKLPKDMFYQLPPMRDAKLLWEFIGRQDPPPFILTAVPKKSDTRGAISERAAEDKKRWMKKHFGVKDARVYAVMRKNKANFAKDGRDGRPNLLIDDHLGNVKEFKAAGGIGVHHIDARTTITKLKKIGYP